MRKSFINELENFCSKNEDIFLLTADLGFKLFDNFRKNHPERFLNMGVAEPNMIGVAAGLALSGKKVYCYSMIPFLIMRCFEHIRVDVCYNNLDVRLIGIGCGLSYGTEGMTHHAIEDLAIMRSLPNMTIVAPGDPLEVSCCIKDTHDHKGPMFIRLGRTGEPQVHDHMPDYQTGKALVVFDRGNDICIIAIGSMLYKAKCASKALADKGYGVTLVSMHTIKPLDETFIKECAGRYRSIFSIEEHSIIGGLGSAISEVLSETDYKGTFKRIGLPDKFSQYAGRPEYLYEKYGLNSSHLAEKISKTVDKELKDGVAGKIY